MFALVDCNNFFVSCERVFNPKLKHKPVVVLSNNDGCVVARSNEVKQLGIPMGIPLFKIQHLIKRHHVQVLSSNFELYGDMSNRIMRTIQQLSPNIEIYSIDEAFLSLAEIKKDIQIFADDLRATVMQWTGIPVSIGIAPSKTLAKLANYLAKTVSASGVFSLADPETRLLYLQHLPVAEVWGVGRRLAPALQHLGIHTAYDLSCYPVKQLRRRFGVMVERIALELQGHACLGLETVAAKQSIQSSRSFGRPVRTLAELQEAISLYAAKACEKLRLESRLVQVLCVYLRTSRFRHEDERYSHDKTESLVMATDDSRVIITQAKRIIAELFVPGYAYAKCGIILMDLVDAQSVQHDIFVTSADESQSTLMQTVDGINKKHGKSTLLFAAEGLIKPWMMKSGARTPRYTTCWHELAYVS